MRRAAALLIAFLASASTSGAQVQPPSVRSIQVGRDTIRFFSRVEEYESEENPVFGFVRASGEWLRLGGPSRTTPRHRPWEIRDAIRVAPGLPLVGSLTPGRQPPGFSRFALIGDDGRRYPVEADASAREAWLVAAYDPWFKYDFATARPHVASGLTRGARLSLATPAPRSSSGRADHTPHYRAAAIAVALRDSALIPALLPLLASDGKEWEIAMRTLIELTGVDSVPAPPRPTAAERQAARAFWEKWWNASGGRGKVVGSAEGAEALRRWRLRWELGGAAR